MKSDYFVSVDYIAAALIFGIGVYYFAGSYEYEMGSVKHMGPGFLPRAYAVCAIILGVLIFFGALRQKAISRSSIDPKYLRSFIMVTLAIISFAIFIPRLGLVPASISAVVLASYGSESFKLSTAFGSAVMVSAVTWVVFSLLLGLPIPGLIGF